MLFMYPYKQGSRSARALIDALDGRMIKLENSRFRGTLNKKVINWGASSLSVEAQKSTVINKLSAVVRAGNKKEFLNLLAGKSVPTLEFTSNKDTVFSWLEQNCTVVVRHSLTGHSGMGIEILEKGLDIPDALLYTKYVSKDGEYRVHVVNGEVIDVQRKIKDPDREVTDWKVRSHKNGFIFVRNDTDGKSYKQMMTEKNSSVLKAAQAAFQVSELNFGAFDVIYNKKRNHSYVLEVNCAPGLEGSSVEIYAEAFKRHFG